MGQTTKKVLGRRRRQRSIRKRLVGTSQRPRLSVYRSAKHIYAQVIDDSSAVTIAAASTLTPALRGELDGKAKKDQAKAVGEAIAKACLAKGVETVAFDRNGFIYHGRIASVAQGARDAGLKF